MYHLLLFITLCVVIGAQQTTFLTTYEWGTSQNDYITSAAYHTQADVIYASGYTYGSMYGTNAGSSDAFVSVLPIAVGPLNLQWGTPFEDRATAVAYDSTRNLIHVVGWTSGLIAGDRSAGAEDGFITTLTVQGPSALADNYQWGTPGSDKPVCAFVDPLNSATVYVAGSTSGAFSGYLNMGGDDVFVSIKDAKNQFRHYQWGTKLSESVGGCAFDTTTGVFYVVGSTTGAFPGYNNSGGYDAFATILSRTGEIKHIQWGTVYSEYVTSAVYNTRLKALIVVGYTDGAFSDATPHGAKDAFLSVISFTTDGFSITNHQWGTTGNDIPTSISTDIVYNAIYVSGYTSGQFSGAISSGGIDAFLSVFAASNPEIPSTNLQWGTNETDECIAVISSSAKAIVYCAGWTTGIFPSAYPQGAGIGGTQLFASAIRKDILPVPFTPKSSSSEGVDSLLSSGNNNKRVNLIVALITTAVYIISLL